MSHGVPLFFFRLTYSWVAQFAGSYVQNFRKFCSYNSFSDEMHMQTYEWAKPGGMQHEEQEW